MHKEGLKPIEIHRQILVIYGENCMSQSQMYNWVEKFRNCVMCLEGTPRPGRPASIVNPDMVEATEDLI